MHLLMMILLSSFSNNIAQAKFSPYRVLDIYPIIESDNPNDFEINRRQLFLLRYPRSQEVNFAYLSEGKNLIKLRVLLETENNKGKESIVIPENTLTPGKVYELKTKESSVHRKQEYKWKVSENRAEYNFKLPKINPVLYTSMCGFKYDLTITPNQRYPGVIVGAFKDKMDGKIFSSIVYNSNEGGYRFHNTEEGCGLNDTLQRLEYPYNYAIKLKFISFDGKISELEETSLKIINKDPPISKKEKLLSLFGMDRCSRLKKIIESKNISNEDREYIRSIEAEYHY